MKPISNEEQLRLLILVGSLVDLTKVDKPKVQEVKTGST